MKRGESDLVVENVVSVPSRKSATGNDPERDRQVRRVISIEGAANLAVLGLKLVVGLATGSMAILGDALHSLTDVANNAVALAAVRVASRPADADHPYGHRKFETLAVFGLAMLLTLLAFELATGALRRSAPQIARSGWALGVMLVVLCVNASVASWQTMRARQLGSDILLADSRHTFADVLTTIVVIAGWQAASYGYGWVDTLAAVAVSLMILVLAFDLFRRSIPILVDQAAVADDVLREAAMSVPGVLDVRKVRSRGAGSTSAAELVVMVSPDLSTARSHEIASAVEAAIEKRFAVGYPTVHVEPMTDRGGTSRSMWIMIAGPYRSGAASEADRQRNLAELNRNALEVFRRGHTPVIGVNLALPIIETAGADDYEAIMMPVSLALADRCDGILRIGGWSPGADDEIERVRRRGGKVFRSLDEIPRCKEKAPSAADEREESPRPSRS